MIASRRSNVNNEKAEKSFREEDKLFTCQSEIEGALWAFSASILEDLLSVL
jgi:hypothetical protein